MREVLTVVCLQVRELETEMNDIGKWLVSAGQTLLAETSIGTTTDQAEALLREHEAIELKCRVRKPSYLVLHYPSFIYTILEPIVTSSLIPGLKEN